MTSPSPTLPTGGPLGSITAQINSELSGSGSSGSSSTSPDDFGLGTFSGTKINPGDLPLIAKGNTTDALLSAFAAGDPTVVASIQRALYLGGYYTSSYVPTYGVVKPQDIEAFGKIVKQTAQTAVSDPNVSVSGLLLQGAKYGTAAGVAAAQTAQKSATATVNLPNTQDLEAEAVSAFQQELGRKATPSEASAFAASYRAMSAGVQRASNQAQFDTENGTGISQKQENRLQEKTAAVGTPVAGTPDQPSGPQPGLDAAAQGLNNQLLADQDTNATSPTFEAQLNSLGTIAQQTQADATPNMTAGGLTQVNQETPESASVAAENFAQNTNPQEAQGAALANQFNNFLSILGSNFGGGSA